MSTNKEDRAKAEEHYRTWIAKQSRRAPPMTEDAADLFPDEDLDDDEEPNEEEDTDIEPAPRDPEAQARTFGGIQRA